MSVYRLDIAYDGTEFSGWQVQKADPSIQGAIQDALRIITKEEVRVIGAGRTDAGVHARGQVAHVRLSSRPLPASLQRALNGLLPPSIRVTGVSMAPEGFHAQKSAIKKEYHYHIWFGDTVLPFDRPYVWHCRKTIDIDLLRKAAALFVGERDFLAYSNAPGRGCARKTTVRTLYRLDVIRTADGVRLEFEGNGFLYKMVRNIVGMMIGVASGKRRLEEIDEVFSSKDRRHAEPGAPPQGLFLMRIWY